MGLDRDGTVQTGFGPIPMSLIEELKKQGHLCYAIGNQELVKEAQIMRGWLGIDKPANLTILKKMHPDCERYIVTDDAPIKVEGWEYYQPHEFLKLFSNGPETK